MESMDDNSEGAEEPVLVKDYRRKRARTVDLGTKGTIKFIQLVRSAECLWNRAVPEYKSRMLQGYAWKEISMQLVVPVSQLQHKWKSLQSSYRHCRSLYSKNPDAPAKWFAYEAMRFLSDECGDTKQELVDGSTQESVYLAMEYLDEYSEVAEESVPVQGMKECDATVFMDENSALVEKSVPVRYKRQRNNTVNLGKEGTLKFIQLVKSTECIWNRRHPQYKNSMRQYEAWKEISVQMGVPSSTLQCKWTSLYSSYRHFRSYYSKASVKAPRKKWFAFEAMRFLNDMKNFGDTKAEKVGCEKQESGFGAVESIQSDNTAEEADKYATVRGMSDVPEESVPVQMRNRQRTKTVELGRKGSLKFIKLVKSAECIWNKRHPQYKNKIAKCNAWKEISLQMGVPISQLLRKWTSLSSSYRHCLSFYPKNPATPRWWAYGAMRFLSNMKEYGDTKSGSVGGSKQKSIHLAIEPLVENSEAAEESVPVQGTKECVDTKKEPIVISKENTLYFISLVKSHVCLWNQKDPDYKNATRRKEAWESISQAMGHSVEALKDKFTSLGDAYRIYCSKYRKDVDAKPHWFAYDALRFLGDKTHDVNPLGTEDLTTDQGKQTLPENVPVQKIMLEPTSDVVTIVNLHDKSVICKRVNQVSSKYPTRNDPKLEERMQNPLFEFERKLQIQQRPPLVIRRVTQPQTKDPLKIEDPLRIKQPTADACKTNTFGHSQQRTSGTGSSGNRLSSVPSFLSYLEHELYQLSTESLTLAQMEMHRIISQYKLKDILTKKAKNMESTGTQTEPLNESIIDSFNSTDFCTDELSSERGDHNFF